mmetsp:Transcript_46481/g.104471  ORF Transcript_46481/g.104471 Transcript_46481/m.104471 type:complete len:406 (-) Transcript_46481:58-1275(-)
MAHFFGLDVLLYVALLAIFAWRQISPWPCCQELRSYVDYVTFFYVLVSCLLVGETVVAIQAFVRIFHGSSHRDRFLAVLLICALPIMYGMLGTSWRLTRQHLAKMKLGTAAAKHERAVHIVALPSVYGLMALCSFVKLYNLVGEGASNSKQEKGIAFARFETYLYVGDLYEAWALYQFGRLTLELLDETFEQRQALIASGTSSARGRNDGRHSPGRRQDSTRDVVLSFTAVSSLAWLGTWLLVVVCVVQAGYSLWLWCFHDLEQQWEVFGGDFHKFSWAGMVASGAAIYNVHIIEQTFGHLMTGYNPLLKFLSVKFLVFFAFWQVKILMVLRSIHVLPLSDIEVKLLHAVLLVLECSATAVMHCWAWGADESWYLTEEPAGSSGEKEPLVGTGSRRPLGYRPSVV